MNFSHNVRQGVAYVLVVVIVVTTVSLVLGDVLGTSAVCVVVSSNMVPTLEIGDLVVAESATFNNIHPRRRHNLRKTNSARSLPKP